MISTKHFNEKFFFQKMSAKQTVTFPHLIPGLYLD